MFELDPALIRPTYDSHSFIALPRSIAGLFGPRHDRAASRGTGRSSRALHESRSHPGRWLCLALLRTICRRSSGAAPLHRLWYGDALHRAIPSTTAAHVTALHTGLEVGQSGIYEWQYYEPELDAIIVPLIFSLPGTRSTNCSKRQASTLHASSCQYALPAVGKRGHCIDGIPAQGIRSIRLLRSHVPGRNASRIPHPARGARQPATCTTRKYRASILPALLRPDRRHGAPVRTGLAPNRREIDAFLTTLERQFLLIGDCTDTLVLLTADHGETGIDPATTLYLDRDPAFHGIERYLKTDRAGHPWRPPARKRFLPSRARGDARRGPRLPGARGSRGGRCIAPRT